MAITFKKKLATTPAMANSPKHSLLTKKKAATNLLRVLVKAQVAYHHWLYGLFIGDAHSMILFNSLVLILNNRFL